MSALVPSSNANDRIEAPGGPSFGPNNSTNPGYYTIVNGSWATPVPTQAQSLLAVAPQSVYALTPEQMDESYWNTYYGGSSVPSVVSHPSSNEDLYRNEQVMVDHYLASGGLIVTSERTGTAQGFSEANAYNYAQTWIASNGGLPSDAVLTFAGAEKNSLMSQTSNVSGETYPNITQYVFIWRHGSSAVVGSDKIQINVDDAGALTTKTIKVLNIHGNCYISETVSEPPWIPVFHIHTYVRVWRTLGAATVTYRSTESGVNAGAYGYCSSDMTLPTSQAQPCGVIPTSTGHEYTDTASTSVLLGTE